MRLLTHLIAAKLWKKHPLTVEVYPNGQIFTQSLPLSVRQGVNLYIKLSGSLPIKSGIEVYVDGKNKAFDYQSGKITIHGADIYGKILVRAKAQSFKLKPVTALCFDGDDISFAHERAANELYRITVGGEYYAELGIADMLEHREPVTYELIYDGSGGEHYIITAPEDKIAEKKGAVSIQNFAIYNIVPENGGDAYIIAVPEDIVTYSGNAVIIGG